MTTRAERVERILDTLLEHDGERDRVVLAAAINDALEPMLLADDEAARSAWSRKTSSVVAIVVVVAITAALVALLVAGAAWLTVKVWP